MLQPENKQKNEKKVVNLDAASDGLENSRSKTPKTFVKKKCEFSLPGEKSLFKLVVLHLKSAFSADSQKFFLYNSIV